MIKKAMTVTYEVENGLYINLTNRCSNNCTFCIRNNGSGAYGSDPLWLEREPSVDEVLSSIYSRDLFRYKEIVFCGYGEPSYRLKDARKIALHIKARYPSIPIRMNTNGQSDLIHGENTAPLFQDAFDVLSISLNTPNAEEYIRLCHPIYGEKAFSALLHFAKAVKNYVPKVLFSVVRQTLTAAELSDCEALAKEAGVSLKIRDYISE